MSASFPFSIHHDVFEAALAAAIDAYGGVFERGAIDCDFVAAVAIAAVLKDRELDGRDA